MKREIEQLINNTFSNKSFDDHASTTLSHIGFSNPKSTFKNLEVLSCHIDFKKLFPKFFTNLIDELSESYDPDRGLNNFERFSEKIFDKNYFYTILNNDPQILKALVVLFSGSQLLTDTLLKDPSLFDWIKEHETLNKSKAKDILYRELWQFLENGNSRDEKLRTLRWFKKREYIRIGLRDLLENADVVETIKDISNLADVCLQNSYEFSQEELIKKHGVPICVDEDGNRAKAEFAILGMGKLGGEELNFSSDIDLIYIYSSDKGKTEEVNNGDHIQSISNHEFFTKLARMITDAINKITADGNVFRVDLGLRPEGQSGDIASSLQSCEIYYESWGQTWERQALVKARISAGSEELGKKFEKIRNNFVYRKYMDFQAVEEIREGKAKIENKLKKTEIKNDVKLGKGGIREIEFTVQVFQLLYGGRDQSVRKRNTLKALEIIYKKNYLKESDYQSLVQAYRFLRNLENNIQISFGFQTHLIPSKKEDQTVLARKMRMKGTGSDSLIEELLSEYEKHTQNVHQIFNGLFESKKDSETKIDEAERSKESESDPLFIIEKCLFKDKKGVLKNLKLMEQGVAFSHPTLRSQAVFQKLVPDILYMASRQSDPDQAVNNLEKVINSFRSRETFFEILKENKKLLELLLVLFGNSGFLSEILIRQPDLLDSLLDIENIYRFKPREKMEKELEKFLDEKIEKEEIKNILRKFKKGEELRVGLRFLLNEANLDNTFKDLSLLAEVYLSCSLTIAQKELTRSYGKPLIKDSNGETHECGFAIIGMGKFGGCELDFGSDLDIVFVYEGEGETEGSKNKRIQNQEYFVNLINVIYDLAGSPTSAGFAYKIDTDLRPEGKKGILALPLSGFEKYFEERAQMWERQSLTRARFMAGSEGLGKKFIELAHKVAYEKRFEYGAPAEMHRLRMKMEKELGKETKKKKDAKVGYGGLVDIEFVAQLLQLKFGGKSMELRRTRTSEVLKEAARIGILSPDQYDQLRESYEFLKQVINGIRIVHERSENKLPESDEKLSKLAFRMGFRSKDENENREGFLKEYSLHTRSVRDIYNSFFMIKNSA